MANKSNNNKSQRPTPREPLVGFEHVIYRNRGLFVDILTQNYNLPSASSNDEVRSILFKN